MLKLALATLFALAAVGALWQYGAGGHSCCTAHAAAQEPGQEPLPGEDPVEPGNPNHERPRDGQGCATKASKNRVACKCARHKKCNPDGTTQESISCRWYCFSWACYCAPACP